MLVLKRLLCACGVLLLINSVPAAAAAPSNSSLYYRVNNQASLALQMVHLNYWEVIGDGVEGEMPGIGLALSKTFGRFYAAVDTNYFYGRPKYGSSTLNTRTTNSVFGLNLKLGRLVDSKRAEFIPYVGVGYNVWQRDVPPDLLVGNFSAQGYHEQYDHFYYGLGVRANVPITQKIMLIPDVLFGYTSQPKIQSDFFVLPYTYHIKLALKERFYFKGKLGFHYFINDATDLSAFCQWEAFQYGRSVTVYPNGSPLSEPDSRTNRVTVGIAIGYALS